MVNIIIILSQRIEQTVDPERYQYSNAVRVGLAVAPGVIMTPLSSILEVHSCACVSLWTHTCDWCVYGGVQASNAGSRNPEPLWRRSTRGIQPRLLREVIFGIGLNQLSDFCEVCYARVCVTSISLCCVCIYVGTCTFVYQQSDGEEYVWQFERRSHLWLYVDVFLCFCTCTLMFLFIFGFFF